MKTIEELGRINNNNKSRKLTEIALVYTIQPLIVRVAKSTNTLNNISINISGL